MQFLVTGLDGTDAGAPARRQAVRQAHLAGAKKLYEEKKLVSAAALLDEAGGMEGSVLIVEFPSQQALHSQWLDAEPYVTCGVWQTVKVQPCKVPDFIHWK